MDTYRGLSVSTNSLEVIEHINHFHNQILGCGNSGDLILDHVTHHPENILLQLYAAAFYLYAQQDQATAQAKNHLLAAEKLLKTANTREQLLFQAVKAWLILDYQQALILLTQITERYPRDTLAAKFAEWIYYCTGQAYQSKRYLALCNNIATHNQDEANFLAMHSFALELCGYYPQAKDMAEQATDMQRVTPWAHHTLAHMYLNSNKIEEGITCLRGLQDSWSGILSLVRGHNTWHLALFYLALRDEQKTMQLYPQIFGILPALPSEQIDAISLLWRMDLAGLPQPGHLKKIGEKLGNNPFEHYTSFNTLHYMYCLTKTDDKQDTYKAIESIKNYIATLPKGENQSFLKTITLPFCEAIISFGKGDFQAAYDLLSPIISHYQEFGGSDAQTELFTQTYLICLLNLDKQREANEFFNRYLSHYKNTPLAEYWFGS